METASGFVDKVVNRQTGTTMLVSTAQSGNFYETAVIPNLGPVRYFAWALSWFITKKEIRRFGIHTHGRPAASQAHFVACALVAEVHPNDWPDGIVSPTTVAGILDGYMKDVAQAS